ncbi:LuxR C-terminal-related transcriptional regulator [Streptomyces sp. NPDC059785]|uniref:LuxR C-terminal-related transcriptional regulator n=1 Tax=Streptomyces sp. NPDC059785 TaxID=3346945 RepID=UPI0036492E3F
MAYRDRWDPQRALAVAAALMRAPLKQVLSTLSEALGGLLAHDALVMLTGDCPKSATWSHGDRALTEAVTAAELAALAARVEVGTPWFDRARLAGTRRPVLAVTSAPPGSAGALLAVLPTAGFRPKPEVPYVVQRLWDLATLRIVALWPTAAPVDQTAPWLASSERNRVVTDLTDAHAATLTALLGVLRDRDLDDGAARRTALDLSVSSLTELRSAAEGDGLPGEETAREAFGRLTDMLGLLSRYGDVELEFSGPAPEAAERLIPSVIAQTARTAARGTALAMLEQGGVGRIRVSWHVGDGELRTVVRDDGPGTLAGDALAVHRLTDRAAAVSGGLQVDAVPGWGTIVTLRLPLTAPERGRGDPLGALNRRELDVLEQLVRGQRNRMIAERLRISEHTVKFHVAKILRKLGVNSRGEAAALALAAGFPASLALTS